MVGLQGGLLQSITSAYNFTLLLTESISLSHYYLQDHAKSLYWETNNKRHQFLGGVRSVHCYLWEKSNFSFLLGYEFWELGCITPPNFSCDAPPPHDNCQVTPLHFIEQGHA